MKERASGLLNGKVDKVRHYRHGLFYYEASQNVS